MVNSVVIPAVVKEILNEKPDLNLCTDCEPGCNDLVKFICLGFSDNDINKWLDNNKEKLDTITNNLIEELSK